LLPRVWGFLKRTPPPILLKYPWCFLLSQVPAPLSGSCPLGDGVSPTPPCDQKLQFPTCFPLPMVDPSPIGFGISDGVVVDFSMKLDLAIVPPSDPPGPFQLLSLLNSPSPPLSLLSLSSFFSFLSSSRDFRPSPGPEVFLHPDFSTSLHLLFPPHPKENWSHFSGFPPLGTNFPLTVNFLGGEKHYLSPTFFKVWNLSCCCFLSA